MKRKLVQSDNVLEFTVISVTDERVTLAVHSYFADECKAVSFTVEQAKLVFRSGLDMIRIDSGRGISRELPGDGPQDALGAAPDVDR